MLLPRPVFPYTVRVKNRRLIVLEVVENFVDGFVDLEGALDLVSCVLAQPWDRVDLQNPFSHALRTRASKADAVTAMAADEFKHVVLEHLVRPLVKAARLIVLVAVDVVVRDVVSRLLHRVSVSPLLGGIVLRDEAVPPVVVRQRVVCAVRPIRQFIDLDLQAEDLLLVLIEDHPRVERVWGVFNLHFRFPLG